MTAVEYILNLVVGEDEQGKDVRVKDTLSKSEIDKAKGMEKEQKILLVQELKDYTYEAQCVLGNDEREASEFVDIFYNKTINQIK